MELDILGDDEGQAAVDAAGAAGAAAPAAAAVPAPALLVSAAAVSQRGSLRKH